ncbi:hypothetical protein K439DRAFT_1640714 [Ramaria rubella]|nr:hypothetical protein K439DRAFT_1640714 [Ramaria rubella]
MSGNPDTRPLPDGWVDEFDEKKTAEMVLQADERDAYSSVVCASPWPIEAGCCHETQVVDRSWCSAGATGKNACRCCRDPHQHLH